MMLERIGYTVVTATSSSEAVEIYRGKESAIDLVILDLKMPGGGGVDVFKPIKEINSIAKILISTGSGHDPEVEVLMSFGWEGVIQKPFGLEAMSNAISEILNRRPH